MFSFSLVNIPENFEISESRISEILAYIEKKVQKKQNWTLNIAFLPDDEIQALNRDYREKDKTTDVLSFHYFDDFSEIENDDIAGECIFSENKILEQSEKFWHTSEEEFFILFIHSVLHILGFDHEEDAAFAKMWELERPIREKFLLSTER